MRGLEFMENWGSDTDFSSESDVFFIIWLGICRLLKIVRKLKPIKKIRDHSAIFDDTAHLIIFLTGLQAIGQTL